MKEIYQVSIPSQELYTRGNTTASVIHDKDCPKPKVLKAISDAATKLSESFSNEPSVRIVPNSETTRTIRTATGDLKEQTDFDCELTSIL